MIRHILVLVGSMIVISGCNKYIRLDNIIRGDMEPYFISIYPGECLKNTQLTYASHGRYRVENVPGCQEALSISFKLSWDIESEWIGANHYREVPPDAVFRTFGKDSWRVKKAYFNIYDDYYELVTPYLYSGINTTVYSYDEISITANREFGGIPPWNNLKSIMLPLSYNSGGYGSTPIPTIDVVDGYCPHGYYLSLSFPLEGHELVAGEEVTFHLEIPVKVGLLLSLLRDRLTDPDAQMQYRDEVLTCDFTINHGLH